MVTAALSDWNRYVEVFPVSSGEVQAIAGSSRSGGRDYHDDRYGDRSRDRDRDRDYYGGMQQGYPAAAPGYGGYDAGYGAAAGYAAAGYAAAGYGGYYGMPAGGYGGYAPGGMMQQQQQQAPRQAAIPSERAMLRLRGVPPYATASDLAAFLYGYGADVSTITLVPGPDGRPSGEVSERDGGRGGGGGF